MSVRPKKRLGQHFLTDPNTVRRIVDAVAAPPGARVVEIGPGEGALTTTLLERYPDLVALEVDPEAVGHLQARFPGLDIRQGDVLDADWAELAGRGARDKGEGGRGAGRGGVGASGGAGRSSQRPTRPGPPPLAPPVQEGDSSQATPPVLGGAVDSGGVADPRSPIPHPPPPIPGEPQASPLFVVGNLPYYITSPILFALLDARAHVARAVVMVQKEVADRLAAGPGSKTYGTLSVYFALYAETRTLFTVSRHCFRPKPSVESAVVALDFAAGPGADVAFGPLQRVVRAAFGQRRKMLRNSLGPVAAAAGVAVPDWAATLRPEAVSPADFVRLAHHVDAG